ncbi:TolC family protein [Allomuricauda sp. SCSIO 65647]|uniref:TolC family protein n=1 Tax=Allomuricauda sp. SCSIO 65647 TaxID=2908843 RepID=UPI001F391938|nr:TolC family protein [Muricauda sp. SCSIO 65647]UJH68383.1 TolC family protein [Muricauda sp. SCSIO 65647]
MKKLPLLLLSLFSVFALAQTKQTYKIGMLLDNQTPELAPLVQQLKGEIKAVVGEDANMEFPEDAILVSNFDPERARSNYNRLLDSDIDIILAFGVLNNEIISPLTVHRKPTILFGAVNRDVQQLDLSKTSSGIENFTYLIESESYQEDLNRFKELSDFKNLGIAVDAPIAEILPLKEIFDAELASLDASYRLIKFESVDDIIANLDEIDALYMAGGFFMATEEKKILIQKLIERKMPSFTVNGPADVKMGFLATLQAEENLDQFFRRIALNIEAYITGTPMAELPVFIDYNPRLTINYNTSEFIEFPIKYSLIAETDFVGEFRNVLSEKEYDLLTVIDQALEQNLAIQSDQRDVDLATQDVKTATSNYLPSLTASGTASYVDPDLAEISNGQNPEFSTAGNLTLNQTIFSEAANANIAIQKKLQKAQQEDFNAAQLDLIFNASNAYFNVLILKANAQIQVRNVDLTKRNLEISKQNFEAGQSGKSDMLRFRSEMAQNTQAMVEAINQLEQGFLFLNQILNNPTDLEIDVADVQMDEGIFEEYKYDELFSLLDNPTLQESFTDFLIQEAYKNAPELKSLGYNLEATDRNIRLNSFGRFLPTVALQGQYNSTFNRSGAGSTVPPNLGFGLVDNYYTAGASISIPIINQNLNNINRQTALIQKDQLEINKDNLELGIAVNVRNGVLNLVNQMSNIQLSKISEETAAEALELTRASYSEGAVNIVQLLDAQNNFLDAQLARANAVYNFLINALQLERFLGYYFLLNAEADNNAFKQRFFEYLNNEK